MRALPWVLAVLVALPGAFAHELTTRLIGPTPMSPGPILVASNGRSFLTVWTAGGYWYGSASGNGISAPSPPVALLPNSAPLVSLVGIGGDYCGALSLDGGGVQLLRFNERAELVSMRRPDIPPLYDPQLAWNGQTLLLIGRDKRLESGTLSGYLLAADGAVARAIGPIATSAWTFAVSADAGEFAVGVGGPLGLRLYQIGIDGTPRDGFVQLYTPTNLTHPWAQFQVAVRGETTAVAWSVYGMNFSLIKDGAVTLRELNQTGLSGQSPLVATNSGFVMASSDRYDSVLLMRFDAQGNPLDSGQHLKGTFGGLAATGNLVQVAYRVRDNIWPKVTAAWFSTDFAAAEPLATATLSMSPAWQMWPLIGSDGVNFFATFTDATADTKTPRFARFTRSGTGLDGPGIPLLAASSDPYSTPFTTATFGGGRYLVGWTDSEGLRLAFLGPDGLFAPFFTRGGAGSPLMVWNGTNFFIAWMENHRFFGMIVSPWGAVGAVHRIAPDPPLGYFGPGAEFWYLNDAAWNGEEYLVTWLAEESYSGLCSACLPPPLDGAYAIHVRADGTPRESTPLTLVPVSRQSLPVSGAHVAGFGQKFVVLIDRYNRVDVAVVNRTGVDGPRPFFEWVPADWYRGPGVTSDVTVDGLGYQAVWRYGYGGRWWIGARRLSSNGTSHEPALVTEAGPPGFYWGSFEICANALGDTAIVTSESIHPGEVERLDARFVSELSPIGSPPPPPRNPTAITVNGRTTISWDGSAGADGYFVESSAIDPGAHATVGAGARTYVYPYAAVRSPVRVRAFNGNGVSEPSTEVVPVEDVTRRRSARH